MANATFEMYDDDAGEYRWRLEAPNYKIIADSGEGYTTKDGCERAIDTVKSYIANATVVDKTKK